MASPRSVTGTIVRCPVQEKAGAPRTGTPHHSASLRRDTKLELGSVPRHGGRIRERGPGPHRTNAMVEVLGGQMRHDLETVEPGGPGLGLHVRDEQPSNTPS